MRRILLWLASLLGPKATDTLPFSASERDIFFFCDKGPQCRCTPGNGRCRRIDPMAVLDVMEECSEQYENDVKLIFAGGPEGPHTREARRRIGETLRKAFRLKPLDDSEGVTWNECMRIMSSFSAFLDRCKKKADVLQTSLGLAPAPSFPRMLSATKNSSESNSTSAGSMPSGPPLQPRVSDSSLAATPDPNSGKTLQTAT